VRNGESQARLALAHTSPTTRLRALVDQYEILSSEAEKLELFIAVATRLAMQGGAA